jgi:hypothetical protein
MKAQKNTQAADNGNDARDRHQNIGDRHALRGCGRWKRVGLSTGNMSRRFRPR